MADRAGREYVWFKWFPARASADLEFSQLTLEEEGMYHRLLDLAARSSPNSKRGWLYSQGRVLSMETLALLTRTPIERLSSIVEALIERGLLARNSVRAIGFPSFRKLQRHMEFRDERGTPDCQQIASILPADCQQDADKKPRLDADAEEDAEVEVEAHKKNPPTPQGGSGEPVLPENLNTPEFKTAWAEWETYRRETKHKLTPTTIKKQYAMLSKVGPDIAVKMIDRSIENTWRGLFPLQDAGEGQGFAKPSPGIWTKPFGGPPKDLVIPRQLTYEEIMALPDPPNVHPRTKEQGGTG